MTGASSGIGRASALLLAGAGCEVVLVARRGELLEQARTECGPQSVACPCDITDREAVEVLVERVAKPDAYLVVVNAAGVAEFGPFAETPMADFERQLAVNLIGPANLCHAAIPHMLQRGGGQIINVLSVAATHVFQQSAAYATSKAALHMLGKSIAADYRQQGVRVTSLLPGATDTPLWEGKAFRPSSADMLPVSSVGEAIRDLVMMPLDRNVDELHLMPPKGIL